MYLENWVSVVACKSIKGYKTGSIPVDARLPCGVEEPVKHEKEHWPNVTRTSPVQFNKSVRLRVRPSVTPLPRITPAPDRHGKH